MGFYWFVIFVDYYFAVWMSAHQYFCFVSFLFDVQHNILVCSIFFESCMQCSHAIINSDLNNKIVFNFTHAMIVLERYLVVVYSAVHEWQWIDTANWITQKVYHCTTSVCEVHGKWMKSVDFKCRTQLWQEKSAFEDFQGKEMRCTWGVSAVYLLHTWMH